MLEKPASDCMARFMKCNGRALLVGHKALRIGRQSRNDPLDRHLKVLCTQIEPQTLKAKHRIRPFSKPSCVAPLFMFV